MVLTERKSDTQLHSVSVVLFALDLEKRQLSVDMMTNSHFVSGPSAASMRVIKLSIESVKIHAFITCPDLPPGVEKAIAWTQRRQQRLQVVCAQQILAIDSLLKGARLDEHGRRHIEVAQDFENCSAYRRGAGIRAQRMRKPQLPGSSNCKRVPSVQ